MPDDTANDLSRLFRSEALVSDGDLRLEVARHIERDVMGNEEILLSEKSARLLSSVHMTRGSRRVEIGGTYRRDVEKDETFAIVSGGSINEVVRGGVDINMRVESESILGGTYTGTVLGRFMRIAALVDFMAWGGWAEVDVSRVEIASTRLLAAWGYAHVTGARVVLAAQYVDDWVGRTENYGVLVDNMALTQHVGGPGSGQENAT